MTNTISWTVDPQSLEHVLLKLAAWKFRMSPTIAVSTLIAAREALNKAIENAPTGDSGILKSSFKLERDDSLKRDIKYKLMNTAPYASYVEFGTGVRFGKPYVIPADVYSQFTHFPPGIRISAPPRGKPKYRMHLPGGHGYPETWRWFTKGQEGQAFMSKLLTDTTLHYYMLLEWRSKLEEVGMAPI